jgi:hypothetical protein
MKRKIAIGLSVFAVLAMVLAACTLSSGLDVSGVVSLKMYDAPISASGYTVIKVTINYDAILIHRTNDTEDSWITVVSNAGTIDNLLDLTSNAPATLGLATVAADKYTQIRIDLATNHTIVVVSNNVTNTLPLSLPTGTNASIKITSAFEITTNNTTELSLDFDAAQSIKAPAAGSSNWQLVPVIRLDKVTSKGGTNR